MADAKRPTAGQIETLKRLGAATVYEGQGQKGALDAGMKPVLSRFRIAGPAFTVKGAPGDNLMLHYAITRAARGDVMVADVGGYAETGHIGDVMALAMKTAGVAGLVIDGAVRDAAGIDEIDFPVFARGLSIKAPSKNQPGALQTPVTVGGVTVRPGDVIVADQDGAVVVALESLDEVIARASERDRHEADLRTKILAGATTVELGNLMPKLKSLGVT